MKDYDFVLIVEGTHTEAQARQEVALVVAPGMADSSRMPAGISLRFFAALTPTAHGPRNAQALLADLDILLDDVPETRQRVIRIAPSVNAPASRATHPARA